jgi:hypothetical protein
MQTAAIPREYGFLLVAAAVNLLLFTGMGGGLYFVGKRRASGLLRFGAFVLLGFGVVPLGVVGLIWLRGH